MRKLTRFSIFILATVLLIIQCTVLTFAITIPDPIKDTYVYDMNNIIDDELEKELNTLLINLNKKTTDEVVVVSLKSLEDITIEEYANELFNTLGIGQKDKDNGVLLIFSKSDNKVRIEVGREFEGILTDSKCGAILDKYFVPNREIDDYNSATDQTTKAIVSVIATNADIELENLDTTQYETEGSNIFLIVLVLFLAVLLLCSILFECESSFSGSSSGGFRGGSSGGGFSGGGFGGGFSSGGGATR